LAIAARQARSRSNSGESTRRFRSAGLAPLAPARRRRGRSPQADGALAAQHCAARVRQPQHVVRVVIDFDDVLGHQLPQQQAPLGLRQFLADAEGRQPLVAELRDLLGGLAAQHVDDVRGAKPNPLACWQR